jgi:NAD(P)H-hydrate epimerase
VFAYLGGAATADDRVAAVRNMAARLRAVVHLKGRRAITASPAGTVWVNTTGNPGQATGGTGDVLTGIVGSFVAQGAKPEEAMWAGAYVHGLAADITAGRIGRRPLAASDIPEALPFALRHIERTVRRSGPIRTVLESAT